MKHFNFFLCKKRHNYLNQYVPQNNRNYKNFGRLPFETKNMEVVRNSLVKMPRNEPLGECSPPQGWRPGSTGQAYSKSPNRSSMWSAGLVRNCETGSTCYSTASQITTKTRIVFCTLFRCILVESKLIEILDYNESNLRRLL